jgi:hypothetical protein
MAVLFVLLAVFLRPGARESFAWTLAIRLTRRLVVLLLCVLDPAMLVGVSARVVAVVLLAQAGKCLSRVDQAAIAPVVTCLSLRWRVELPAM